ncbi:MAG: hypothetical protein GXO26_06845 [Crenarchaeota archaeon]|nr:hypothetical protein [Thermoproteota archaeon]
MIIYTPDISALARLEEQNVKRILDKCQNCTLEAPQVLEELTRFTVRSAIKELFNIEEQEYRKYTKKVIVEYLELVEKLSKARFNELRDGFRKLAQHLDNAAESGFRCIRYASFIPHVMATHFERIAAHCSIVKQILDTLEEMFEEGESLPLARILDAIYEVLLEECIMRNYIDEKGQPNLKKLFDDVSSEFTKSLLAIWRDLGLRFRGSLSLTECQRKLSELELNVKKQHQGDYILLIGIYFDIYVPLEQKGCSIERIVILTSDTNLEKHVDTLRKKLSNRDMKVPPIETLPIQNIQYEIAET